MSLVNLFKAIFSEIMHEWKLSKKVRYVFDPLISMIGTGNPLLTQQTSVYILSNLLKWVEEKFYPVLDIVGPKILQLYLVFI